MLQTGEKLLVHEIRRRRSMACIVSARRCFTTPVRPKSNLLLKHISHSSLYGISNETYQDMQGRGKFQYVLRNVWLSQTVSSSMLRRDIELHNVMRYFRCKTQDSDIFMPAICTMMCHRKGNHGEFYKSRIVGGIISSVADLFE